MSPLSLTCRFQWHKGHPVIRDGPGPGGATAGGLGLSCRAQQSPPTCSEFRAGISVIGACSGTSRKALKPGQGERPVPPLLCLESRHTARSGCPLPHSCTPHSNKGIKTPKEIRLDTGQGAREANREGTAGCLSRGPGPSAARDAPSAQSPSLSGGRSHSKRILQAKPGTPLPRPPNSHPHTHTGRHLQPRPEERPGCCRHLTSVSALHLCFQFCPIFTLLNTRETTFSLQLESVTPPHTHTRVPLSK